MIRQFLAHFPYAELAIAGQLIFMTIFLGSIIWIFRKGSKDFYDKLSKLPLGGNNE